MSAAGRLQPKQTVTVTRTAGLSEDGTFRYWLGRRWADGSVCVFCMLNPSKADHLVDDPTARRCVGFARSWGCGGLFIINLYALRATDPAALWKHSDPVGPENDRWLTDYAELADRQGWPLIAAWGANARTGRVAAVLDLPGMDQMQHLGLTKAGAPRHPSRLRAGAERAPFRCPS